MSCMSPFSGDRRWVPRVPNVKECFQEFSPQVRFRFEANDRNRIILNLEISVQMAFFVYQNSMGIFNWKNHHVDSMDSGWVRLRFRLFWTILAQALNEMWPIEVLGLFFCLYFFPNSKCFLSFVQVSLCRRKWETRRASGQRFFKIDEIWVCHWEGYWLRDTGRCLWPTLPWNIWVQSQVWENFSDPTALFDPGRVRVWCFCTFL